MAVLYHTRYCTTVHLQDITESGMLRRPPLSSPVVHGASPVTVVAGRRLHHRHLTTSWRPLLSRHACATVHALQKPRMKVSAIQSQRLSEPTGSSSPFCASLPTRMIAAAAAYTCATYMPCTALATCSGAHTLGAARSGHVPRCTLWRTCTHGSDIQI
jgi:hypothetical protein